MEGKVPVEQSSRDIGSSEALEVDHPFVNLSIFYPHLVCIELSIIGEIERSTKVGSLAHDPQILRDDNLGLWILDVGKPSHNSRVICGIFISSDKVKLSPLFKVEDASSVAIVAILVLICLEVIGFKVELTQEVLIVWVGKLELCNILGISDSKAI